MAQTWGSSPPVLLMADVFEYCKAARLPVSCAPRLTLLRACLCFWACEFRFG